MLIREYTEADWPSVWPIIRQVVTAGEPFAYDPGWSSEQARDVWVVVPPGRTVVACDGPRVLGTAHMGPDRPGPGSHVSTASFMVAGDARGRGFGRGLGEYALSWAREQGYGAMQFNAVAESNHVAVRLWQALGFRIIGTVPRLSSTPRWAASASTSCTNASDVRRIPSGARSMLLPPREPKALPKGCFGAYCH